MSFRLRDPINPIEDSTSSGVDSIPIVSSTINNGDTLIFNDEFNVWEYGPGTTISSTTISDLTDVIITDIGASEVLQYDDGMEMWFNKTLAEAGISTSDISDFNTSSDARISLQAGVGLATLVSGKVPSSQLSLSNVIYCGTWNATTNSPSLSTGISSGGNGCYYVVSVQGATELDTINDWEVGDWVIFNGTAWEKVDNTDIVTSVAGKQGAVTLSLTDITDVTIASVVDNHVLQYDSGNWVNKTLAVAGIASTSHAHANTANITASGTDTTITGGLSMTSTTDTITPPRLTIFQRDSLSSPFEGAIIYNTDSDSINVYSNLAWNSLVFESDGSGNVSVGVSALENITTGLDNTCIGNASGGAITTGSQNVLLGRNADATNANMTNCVGIGYNCRVGNGDNRIAIGQGVIANADNQVIIGNTSITENIFSGELKSDTIDIPAGGYKEVTIPLSMTKNINSTTYYNGTGAGLSLTSASDCILSGANSGANITDAISCIGIGTESLKFTTGSFNTAIGSFSQFGNSSIPATGEGNVSVGALSLQSITTGASNTCIGTSAGFNLTTGSQNVLLGRNADATNANMTNCVGIGYNCLVGNGDNRIVIGQGAIANADNQVIIGNTSITENIFSGELKSDTIDIPAGGYKEVTIPLSMTKNINSTTYYNGTGAGLSLTSAIDCILSGANSGANITDAISCIGIGSESLKFTTGSFNTAIGSLSQFGNSSIPATGEGNVSVGALSLRSITTGASNTCIGTSAGFNLTTGSDNVLIGRGADDVNTIMNNCVGIGRNCRVGNGDNRIAIGQGAIANADNQVIIGNGNITENIFSGKVVCDTFEATSNFSMNKITQPTAAAIGNLKLYSNMNTNGLDYIDENNNNISLVAGDRTNIGYTTNMVGASMIASVRKLLPLYTGACCRIRRSGDSAEQDIAFSGSGIVDKNEFVTFLAVDSSTNGFITTLYDQTENGGNLVQSTIGLQPELSFNGNIPIITWVNHALVSSNDTNALGMLDGTWAISVGFKTNATAASRFIYSNNAVATELHLGQLADMLTPIHTNPRSILPGGTWNDNVFHTVTDFQTADGNVYLRYDSVNTASQPSTANSGAGLLTWGRRSDISFPYVGEMSEFIVWNVIPSDTILTMLETDQQNLWVNGMSAPFNGKINIDVNNITANFTEGSLQTSSVGALSTSNNLKTVFRSGVNSAGLVYTDSHINLMWNSANQQLTYTLNITPNFTFMDICNLFQADSILISVCDDIATGDITIPRFFSVNGILDTAYSHVNFGSVSTLHLMTESRQSDYPSYKIKVMVGGAGALGSGSLTVVVNKYFE
jgi:hypothetical protein